MYKIKQWLKDYKPVFNKTMYQELMYLKASHDLVLGSRKLEHERELEKVRKLANDIVTNLSDIQFRKGYNDREYTVCCNFNTEMMVYGNHDPRALEYIAAHTAHEIEHYIKTAKFMHLQSSYN